MNCVDGRKGGEGIIDYERRSVEENRGGDGRRGVGAWMWSW